ncbi:MAG: amidohydrolase family protein [Alphaproteobacteria bacterium]|nr:amidohydrolase family protein [Alphaproteobacteria bacterium]
MTRIMLSAPVWWPGRPKSTPELAESYLSQAAAMRALSRKHHVGFTQDGHQKSTIRIAHERGLLGPDAVMSHCIDLDPDEIEAIVATDTKVAHNPSANFSIKGRCPAIELMERGATVAIGSDGTAPDRSYDMFRHMWQAMHYHRRHFRDASVLPPGKPLQMVTIDAARALGLEAELGSLEAGKRADVTLVNLEAPHLYPPNMPLYRLTCFAVGSDVDTVIVAGEIRMEGRRVLSVDERAVLGKARQETEAMLARTGLDALLATPAGFWGKARAGA